MRFTHIPAALVFLASIMSAPPGYAQSYFLDPGHPGVDGIPFLDISGTLVAGAPTEIAVSGAAANAPAIFVLGYSTIYFPILDGILVPNPDISLSTTTTSSGASSFQFSWPNMPHATPLYAQCTVADVASSAGLAFSDAWELRTHRTVAEWWDFWNGGVIDARDAPAFEDFLAQVDAGGLAISSRSFVVQVSGASGSETLEVVDVAVGSILNASVAELPIDGSIFHAPMSDVLIVISHDAGMARVSIVDWSPSGDYGVFQEDNVAFNDLVAGPPPTPTLLECYQVELNGNSNFGKLYTFKLGNKILCSIRAIDPTTGAMGPHDYGSILCWTISGGGRWTGNNEISLIEREPTGGGNRGVIVDGTTGSLTEL